MVSIALTQRTMPIEAQVELALATPVPKGKALRLVSEPGIGRNASLRTILDERSSHVVHVDAWHIDAWSLRAMAEALAGAEYIVFDGLSATAHLDRTAILDLLVTRKLKSAPVKFQAGDGETVLLREDVVIIVSDSMTERHWMIGLEDPAYAELFVTVELETPVAVLLVDQAEMPDYNPAANAGRGEWGLRDVSEGAVTAHETDIVRCADHGAMNSVSPTRTLWRCLACGRAAYRIMPEDAS